ncbi:MAG: hypothetical protein J5902_06085 [Paludibacteraceae bacterium]|nr:hypothetical protein [Paludibacteraceae bacterium]MBQ9295957.1 hypothetical protein [Paludibacteraceae bacterium]
MQTALLIILVVAVLIFGFWLIQYSQFRNEDRKRQWELKRESQKVISPIRLRAYERLALLLERTTPEHMLMELRQKEPNALATWSVGQVQQYLLQTIRIEYEHNQSQQVYVSDEVWTLIMNARDQMAAFVISIAAQIPADATAQVYASALLTAYASNGTTPTDKAMEELKAEAKELM